MASDVKLDHVFLGSRQQIADAVHQSTGTKGLAKTVADIVASYLVVTPVLSRVEWDKRNIMVINDPPLPLNISTVLNEQDPFFPGKRLGETCALVLRPLQISAESCHTFLTGRVEVAQRFTYQVPNCPLKVSIPQWVLIHKQVVPESCGCSHHEMVDMTKGREQWELASVEDVMCLLDLATSDDSLQGFREDKTHILCQNTTEEPYVTHVVRRHVYLHRAEVDNVHISGMLGKTSADDTGALFVRRLT